MSLGCSKKTSKRLLILKLLLTARMCFFAYDIVLALTQMDLRFIGCQLPSPVAVHRKHSVNQVYQNQLLCLSFAPSDLLFPFLSFVLFPHGD